MFIRVNRQKQGKKEYRHLQIAESYRDPEKGNSPRTRILAYLGTVEGLGEEQIEKLIAGLKRSIGQDSSKDPLDEMFIGRDFGHVYAVSEIWKTLGLSEILSRLDIDGGASFPVAELIKLMVVNRVCDPRSKLALLEWLDTVRFPGFEKKPSYHHLLRAMDRLMAIKEKAEPLIAKKFLSMFDSPVDLVFYDITSTYFTGDASLEDDDIRRFGYSRDGRFDKRQVTLGVVMTRDGVPLCHHVFPGNTVDKTTVTGVVKDLKERFHIGRVIFVADRGMLSDLNLEVLLNEELGFIVAHPLRRSAIAREVITQIGKRFDRTAVKEQFADEMRTSVRFVVAFSPRIAAEVKEGRTRRLRQADSFIRESLSRLAHPASRGRKPTPQGTYDKIRDYLRDKNLLSFYAMEIQGDEVLVASNKEARKWEETIDGMLLLETTDMQSPAADIVRRYKELAEIERGFRTLKSALKLRPVFHWTHDRIKAHIFLCVLALQIERLMRHRLHSVSVRRAIDRLRQIKVGVMKFGDVSTKALRAATEEQQNLFKSLEIAAPRTTSQAKNV
jgi:transposase